MGSRMAVEEHDGLAATPEAGPKPDSTQAARGNPLNPPSGHSWMA